MGGIAGARRRRRWDGAGTLLALLLLVVRLAVPSHALPASVGGHGTPADLAGLLGEVPICHADPGPTPSGPGDEPAVPAAHDCALCPACQLASPPVLVPAATWVAAPPVVGRANAALRPPSTGPPRPERLAARPRGPPSSVV